VVAAGFECDVQCRTLGFIARFAECVNFGVWAAVLLVITTPKALQIVIDNHGADHGIGLDMALTARGEF
jgi:hypothetical protein